MSRHRGKTLPATPDSRGKKTGRGHESGSYHEPAHDPGPHKAARIGQSADIGDESLDAILAPGLYVTATPLGNAADLTLRALRVLRHCDAIIAEDTRVTSRLLAIHGISRPLLTYNDHNAPGMRPKLLSRLKAGEVLALVSDAGTPLISDPGHKLVKAVIEAGIAVFPVPGASAAVAALSVAGLPTDRFFFAGFLPSKRGERQTTLAALKSIPATLVFYESPGRIGEALADMAEILGPREAAVARELTKLHEEIRRLPLNELAASYAEGAPKGEITVVVGPPPDAEPDMGKADALLRAALPFMPVNAAASLVAEATGIGRRQIYAHALALKKSDGEE